MTTPKPQLRVLLLLDKGGGEDDEQQTNAAVARAVAALTARRPELDIVLTTTHDAYARYGLTETTMDGYTRRVARGVNPQGQPLFHAFVRFGRTCGRGTAEIVKWALEARKQAFIIDDDGSFHPIHGVEPGTGEWINGYGLRTVPYLTLDT